MSRYDFLSLIKQKAKAISRDTSVKLSVAQEQLARSGGFQHFHELIKVASNIPNDKRLMRLALNVDDLPEIIYEDSIYEELNFIIDDLMSADIAGTNALGFFIDDLVVNSSSYNTENGIATIQAEITYTGEQDPDRVFSGSQFYLTVLITLMYRNRTWSFADDGCEITESISDQELDWQQQLADGLI